MIDDIQGVSNGTDPIPADILSEAQRAWDFANTVLIAEGSFTPQLVFTNTAENKRLVIAALFEGGDSKERFSILAKMLAISTGADLAVFISEAWGLFSKDENDPAVKYHREHPEESLEHVPGRSEVITLSVESKQGSAFGTFEMHRDGEQVTLEPFSTAKFSYVNFASTDPKKLSVTGRFSRFLPEFTVTDEMREHMQELLDEVRKMGIVEEINPADIPSVH